MNATRKFQLLIIALIIVVTVGLVLLVSRYVYNYGGVAYEAFTYILSIVALVLAILSVVNGLRQGRAMKRIVRDVHEELRQVTNLSEKIEEGIKEDQQVNRAVASILAKYGVEDTPKIRRTVKHKTLKHIKKHGL